MVNRIQDCLEKPDALSPNQLRVRKACSTVDAISMVMNIAQEATIPRIWRSGDYCAIVTLVIKNAFNSANWSQIMGSLVAFKVPAYLQHIKDDYFNNRLLLYDTEDGVRQYQGNGGASQESALGPTLCNATYEYVLKIALLVEVTLGPLTAICNDAISRIRKWLIVAKEGTRGDGNHCRRTLNQVLVILEVPRSHH